MTLEELEGDTVRVRRAEVDTDAVAEENRLTVAPVVGVTEALLEAH